MPGPRPTGSNSPPGVSGRRRHRRAGTGGDGMRSCACPHTPDMVLIPFALSVTALVCVWGPGHIWPAAHRLEFAGGGFGSSPAPAGRARAGTGGNGMRSCSCQHAPDMVLIPFALSVTAVVCVWGPGHAWPTAHRLEFAGGGFGSPPANRGWGCDAVDAVAPTFHVRSGHSALVCVVFYMKMGA
jgi:hypothetical protein